MGAGVCATRLLAARFPTLQAAFDEAAQHGTATVYVDRPYDVADHLYLSGNTNLECVGGGELIITGPPPNGLYYILCGIKGYGATTSNGLLGTWTGEMRNVRISQSFQSDTIYRAINLIRVDGCKLIGTYGAFGTAPNATGLIGGYNNANFCNPSLRRNIEVRGTRAVFLHDATRGCEGIGFGTATNVTIEDAELVGLGDDAVAVHNSTGFTIRGVRADVLDGRIYLESSTDGTVELNRIRRIPHPATGAVVSGGALLMTEVSPVPSRPAPADLAIVDNTLIHNDGIVSPTYGLRLRGTKDATVTGNRVAGGGGYGYGITWEQQTIANWVDPTGEEADTTARSRRLRIVDDYYDPAVSASAAAQKELGPRSPGPIWTD